LRLFKRCCTMKKLKVTPGDELAVIEEFVSGDGVYEDPEGYIRSLYVGRSFFDLVKRVANVIPAKKPSFPKPGDTVVGVVTNMKPDLVIADLYGRIVSLGKQIRLEEFSGTLTGLIPINMVAQEYVKDLYDYFSIGDIIMAQVVNSRNPFYLTTRKPSHGVVFSLCHECGHQLDILDERHMKCPVCGSVVKKKVALVRNAEIIVKSIKRMLAFHIY